MSKNKAGYSLVELLVVTAMLGVISLAIFSTFNSGLKVWQKVNKHASSEELGLFFDKLARDLGNCLKNGNIAFSGERAGLKIPCLVYSRQTDAAAPGLAVYTFDPSAGVVKRQEKNYSQLYTHQEGTGVPLVKNLRSFELEYYFYDKQKQEYLWKEEWSGLGMPLAVRLILEFNDSTDEKIVRTFNIPIAG